MATPFTSGDTVQTAFGKGTVREVRNGGRLLVEVKGQALDLKASDVSPLESPRRPSRRIAPGTANEAAAAPAPYVRPVASEVDLHGLTVEEALARAEEALNDALLGDLPELRLIHGRSGGRIRDGLHRWLRELPSVCGFRVDPRNAGVTIVEF